MACARCPSSRVDVMPAGGASACFPAEPICVIRSLSSSRSRRIDTASMGSSTEAWVSVENGNGTDSTR
ncbi:hypothetical protein D3C78_1991510 [compost metagenome]